MDVLIVCHLEGPRVGWPLGLHVEVAVIDGKRQLPGQGDIVTGIYDPSHSANGFRGEFSDNPEVTVRITDLLPQVADVPVYEVQLVKEQQQAIKSERR